MARRKPGKADPSRARRGSSYADKREFYRDSRVAQDYDFHRWGSRQRQRRNLIKWRRIVAALEEAGDITTVLDVPCGTGRFTGPLAARGLSVTGADISTEMMAVARGNDSAPAAVGYVQADAERMPFADNSFDCVLSIRFLFHVDVVTRARILAEMARVSRRWLVLDYRHKYSYRYAVWRIRYALGLTSSPLARVGRRELERELAGAGIRLCRIFPIAPLFSDKWVVLGETQA